MLYENSRYLQTAMYTRLGENTPILKHRKRFDFDLSKATMYEWKDKDTLDGVAQQLYGNAHLRWAILDANPQYRTEFDIKYGDKIFIPDYDEILDIVNV